MKVTAQLDGWDVDLTDFTDEEEDEKKFLEKFLSIFEKGLWNIQRLKAINLSNEMTIEDKHRREASVTALDSSVINIAIFRATKVFDEAASI